MRLLRVLGRLRAEEVTEGGHCSLRVRYWKLGCTHLRGGPEGLAVTMPAAAVLCRLGARGSLWEMTVALREGIRAVSIGGHYRARR